MFKKNLKEDLNTSESLIMTPTLFSGIGTMTVPLPELTTDTTILPPPFLSRQTAYPSLLSNLKPLGLFDNIDGFNYEARLHVKTIVFDDKPHFIFYIDYLGSPPEYFKKERYECYLRCMTTIRHFANRSYWRKYRDPFTTFDEIYNKSALPNYIRKDMAWDNLTFLLVKEGWLKSLKLMYDVELNPGPSDWIQEAYQRTSKTKLPFHIILLILQYLRLPSFRISTLPFSQFIFLIKLVKPTFHQLKYDEEYLSLDDLYFNTDFNNLFNYLCEHYYGHIYGYSRGRANYSPNYIRRFINRIHNRVKPELDFSLKIRKFESDWYCDTIIASIWTSLVLIYNGFVLYLQSLSRFRLNLLIVLCVLSYVSSFFWVQAGMILPVFVFERIIAYVFIYNPNLLLFKVYIVVLLFYNLPIYIWIGLTLKSLWLVLMSLMYDIETNPGPTTVTINNFRVKKTIIPIYKTSVAYDSRTGGNHYITARVNNSKRDRKFSQFKNRESTVYRLKNLYDLEQEIDNQNFNYKRTVYNNYMVNMSSDPNMDVPLYDGKKMSLKDLFSRNRPQDECSVWKSFYSKPFPNCKISLEKEVPYSVIANAYREKLRLKFLSLHRKVFQSSLDNLDYSKKNIEYRTSYNKVVHTVAYNYIKAFWFDVDGCCYDSIGQYIPNHRLNYYNKKLKYLSKIFNLEPLQIVNRSCEGPDEPSMLSRMFSLPIVNGNFKHEVSVEAKKEFTDTIKECLDVLTKMNVDVNVGARSDTLDNVFKFFDKNEYDSPTMVKLAAVLAVIGLSALSRKYVVGAWAQALVLGIQTGISYFYLDDPVTILISSIVSLYPVLVFNDEDSTERVCETAEETKDTISKGILSYFYMSTFGKCETDSLSHFLDDFINKTKDAGRIKNSTEVNVEFFMELLGSFGNYLSSATGIECLKNIHNPFPELRDLTNEFGSLATRLAEEKNFTRDESDILNNIEQRIRGLKAETPSNPRTVYKHKGIDNLLSLVKDLKSKFVAYNFSAKGIRPASICLGIFGVPGSGKSLWTPMLAHHLACRVMPIQSLPAYKRNSKDFIYNRLYEAEFWASYKGEYFTFIDELGQLTERNPNGFLSVFELFRMINNAEYTTNQAHLDLKGNTVFTSKCVIFTTNVREFKYADIQDVRGIIRRITIPIFLMPTEKYTVLVDGVIPTNIWDRVLDKSKLKFTDVLQADNTIKRKYVLDTDAWYICHYDVVKKTIIKSYGYDEGMDWIVAEYKKYTQQQNDLIESLDGYLEECYNNRMLEELGIPIPEVQAVPPNDTSGLNSSDIKFVTKISESLSMSFAYVKSIYLKTEKSLRCNIELFIDKCYTNVCRPVYEYCRDFANDVYDWTKQNPTLAKIILISPFIVLAWNYYSRELLPESGQARIRTARQKIKVVKPMSHAPIVYPRTTELATYSKNTEAVAMAIVHHNYFSLFMNYLGPHDGTETFDKDYKRIYGLIVVDVVGLGSVHLTEYLDNRFYGCEKLGLEPDPDLALWLCNAKYPRGWTFFYRDIRESIFTFPECPSDRAFFPFNSFITSRRNILNFFAPGGHPAFSKPFGGMLIFARHDEETNQNLVLFPSGNVTVTGPISWGKYVVPFSFEYSFAKNANKDCGAPLLMCDHEYPQCYIIATHASGYLVDYGVSKVKYGNALPILREEVEAALAHVGCRNNKIEEIPVRVEELSCDLLQDFPIHGITLGISCPEKSVYVKTRLFEKFGPTPKCPAICTEENLAKARNKYSPNLPPMDDKLLRAVTTSFISRVKYKADFTNFKFIKTKSDLLSFQDSVLAYGCIPSASRQTSAGFPECLLGRKKQHLFGSTGDYSFDSADCLRFEKECEIQANDMCEGILPLYIFVDFYKDETLPVSKVLVDNPYTEGKNRMVSGSDFHLTVNDRRIYLPVLDHIVSQPFVYGIALGLNPASSDWTTLVNNLFAVSKNNLLSVDHKGWDTRFRCHVMYYVNVIYVEMFFVEADEQLLNYLACCYRALANSMHLASFRTILTAEVINYLKTSKLLLSKQVTKLESLKEGDEVLLAILYEMFNSMSSGHNRTSPNNSFGNQIEQRYVIAKVILDGKPYVEGSIDFSEIEDNYFSMNLGDDFVASIGDPLVEKGVTPSTMQREFKRIGREITDDLKTDGELVFKDVTQITYLCRSFVFDPTLRTWLAALSLDSIYASLYWMRENGKENDFRQVIQNAIIELSAHGYDVFTTRAPPIIKEAYICYGFYVPIREWKDAVAAFMSLDLYQS